MKLKKVLVHASQALFAMIVLSCFVAGCSDNKEEVYPAEGAAYMDDPAFKRQLEAQDAERRKILGDRAKIFEEFAALEKRAGSRAAAEKLPEHAALTARAQACARTFESNRLQTMKLVRDRAKQAAADSERIRRGEARAKKAK